MTAMDGVRGWRVWWLGRLPRTPAHRLTHRTLYVLPTRPGWMLTLTLTLLLVGSINFQLNLGYALTFMLAGSAAAAVWSAHANMRGLTLTLGDARDAWAGQPATLTVRVTGAQRPRWAVEVDALGGPPAVPQDLVDPEVAIEVPWVPPRRGWQPAPLVRVATRYPLGVCRVWSWWRPASDILVYPAPEPDAPPPPLTPSGAGSASAHGGACATGWPDDVRPWHAGDSARQVLWKKAAQVDDDPTRWWVRTSRPDADGPERWLDEADCALPDVERRRARLCAWVLQAERSGGRYGLRVGGITVPPGRGPEHRRRCLEVLACH
ncbi:hypothetical protein Taqua_00350 [Tepidimonas aquatica]|uniref:DUF58 domain-containing protein n=2 Tax=Tepidimonas aquatica TaxID=247482 RepID=A0A554WVL9_9BURK|nr:hypothetical protein Taqua_00350 [Tepidimonas aquatica]